MFEREIQETDAFQKIIRELSFEVSAERLRQLGSELLTYLFHSDCYWRRQAAKQLGALRERAFWSYPALLAQLSKETAEDVTISIINALGEFYTPHEEITEHLLSLFHKTRIFVVKRAIIEALGTSGAAIALPQVEQALRDEYLAPSAVFALYCQGVEGARILEENQGVGGWWDWALQTGQEKAARCKTLNTENINKILLQAPSYLQKKLALHKNISDEAALQFATSPDPILRRKVALNQQAPVHLLQELSLDPHENVRCGVATNLSIPSEIIELLSIDGSLFVRGRLAANSSIDGGLLEKFAMDESAYLRRQAARNPNIPTELLAVLAKDASPKVRESVAASRVVPEAVLLSLVQDIGLEVRRSAVQNPRIPKSRIEALAIQDEETRNILAGVLDLPARIQLRLARAPDLRIRLTMATNPKTPGWLLRLLSKDADPEVRRFAVSHNDIPEDALVLLAQSEDDNIREVVATNSKTPELVLQKLAHDPFSVVWRSLGDNPSVPPSIFKELPNRGAFEGGLASNPNVPFALLLKVGDDKFANPKLPLGMFPAYIGDLPAFVLWVLAKNPRTPEHLLEQLSKLTGNKAGFGIRKRVAQNESTPEYVLLEIASDQPVIDLSLLRQKNLAPSLRESLLRGFDESKREIWFWWID